MNEVLNCLKTRRSIRAYEQRQVPEDVLMQILKAGTYAPTAMNRQTPVMVVLRKKEDIEALEAMNAEVMGRPGSHPFYGAPTVVIVLADASFGTWVDDGALVMGNLMNAAHALGVGSCWINRAREEFDSPEGKKLLEKWGLPTTLRGVGHCILGYAKETPEPKKRKDDYIVFVD